MTKIVRLRAAASTAAVLAAVPAYGQRVFGLDTSSAANASAPSQTLWNGAFTAGYRFAFVRSSRGGLDAATQARIDDGQFYDNISRATAAGVLCGSYHFMRADLTHGGAIDAQHYLERAGMYMKPGYLLPVADLESGATQHTAASLTNWANDFIGTIEAAKGITPIVYQNTSYANDEVSKSLAFTGTTPRTHLWLARPAGSLQTGNPIGTSLYADPYGMWDPAFTSRGANPIDPAPPKPWSFWQNGSNSALGFLVDYNAANGNIEFVKDFLVPALWTTAGDGDWNTISNWNSDNPAYDGTVAKGPAPRLPNNSSLDWVQLKNVLGGTVTIAAGTNANVRKIFTQQPLVIAGGSLAVTYLPGSGGKWDLPAEFSGPVTMEPSALYSAHTTQINGNGGQLKLNGGEIAFHSIDLASHATAPGELLLNGDVTVTPNGAAVIRSIGSAAQAGRVTLGDGGHILTINKGAAPVDLTVAAPIIGNGRLIKSGAGLLQLAAANTYTGGTTIDSGVVRVTSDSNLGAVPAATHADNIILNGGTLQTGTQLDNVNLSNGGSGYTSFPTVNFAGAGPDGITPTANVLASVASIQVTAGGSGYTGPGGAAVRLYGGGGSGATATATVVSGVVTAINITNSGGGYTSMPGVYITPGPASGISGTGAAAVISAINLTGMQLTSAGFDFASPIVTLIGGGGTGATALASAITEWSTPIERGLTLAGPGGTLYQTAGSTLTFAGVVTGPSSATLVKAGPGTLVLSNSNTNSGPISLVGGTLAIGSVAALGDGSVTNTVNFAGGTLRTDAALASGRTPLVSAAGGTFDSAGHDSTFAAFEGPGQLAKTGAGILTVNRLLLKQFAGNEGSVAIVGSDASVVESLSFTSGNLDVAQGKLIVNQAGATAAVRDHLKAGHNNGTWNGAGIITSDPLAVSQIKGLAIATAGELNVSTFGGVAVAPTDTLVFPAYAGDCDLNNFVDGDDYFVIDTNFQTADTAAITWRNGDLNYDGSINADDYPVIDASYAGQAAAGVAAVPEPAHLGIVLSGMAIWIRRTRRDQSRRS